MPLAVVSNTGWDVRTVFAARDLLHLVHTFVLSYEVGAVKPSPQIFHDACRALHVQPQHALMVGDDPVADAGAVRAGLRTLLLPALPPGAANGVEAAARIVTGE
jgi:HAD superfamily hydrolase (TIGR01549 family)